MAEDEESVGPELLKANEVAKLLMISKRKVYKLARAGYLPCFQLGPRRTRFNKKKVLAWASTPGLKEHLTGGKT